MDVDALLARIRYLYERILPVSDADGMSVNSEDAEELAEAVNDLDAWLSKGGFLPADWSVMRAR